VATQSNKDAAAPGARLVNFQDTSGPHDRRFLLAAGKALGAFAVDINTGKPLTVVVIHGHLPVTVLAPAVPAKPARSP
jgi:hypothetical protein